MNDEKKSDATDRPKTAGPRRRLDFASVLGAPLAIGVIVLAQRLSGGRLASLLQAEAAVIVFGGTLAALLLSYPFSTLRRAFAATVSAFMPAPLSRAALVAEF